MLVRRIVPCLDIKEGRVVKGVRFVELSDAGDPVELARRYENEGADELVFLDITATVEGRRATLAVVRAVAAELTIPFAVGGGVQTVEDMNDLLRAGCDKVSVNSAALTLSHQARSRSFMSSTVRTPPPTANQDVSSAATARTTASVARQLHRRRNVEKHQFVGAFVLIAAGQFDRVPHGRRL